MRVCPVCGTPVAPGNNFCMSCGARLTVPKPANKGVSGGLVTAIIVGGIIVSMLMSLVGMVLFGLAVSDFDEYDDDFGSGYLDDFNGGNGGQNSGGQNGQGKPGGFGSDDYQGGEDWLFGE